MTSLWNFAALVEAMKGRPFGPEPGPVNGISIDSRTVQPGEAFFAIRGDRFDGHDYVGSALARGAATAIVAEERLAGLGRITGSMVVVPDPLDALRLLGRAARDRSGARIAAVTGSVGKTGSKEMLIRALGGFGQVHGSPASFNNHWGVPLTLARMPADARYGVFEIGMNHSGEITPLSVLVRPHAAIITTVEPVHLEAFSGIEGIAAAKAEIFLGLEPDGVAILNRDNAQFDLLGRLAAAAGVGRVISFGEDRNADARLDDFVLEAEGSTVSASILGRDITYYLGAPGRHVVQNSLAVLAAAVVLGRDPEEAAAALASAAAPAGRGERVLISAEGGSALLIDESYNANPASMRAAIALLGQNRPAAGGLRVAVLGDMLELGSDEAAMHAALIDPLVAAGADRVYLAGKRMAALWEVLPHDRRGAYCESAAELEPILLAEIGKGDVVMVKGSNGSRLGPLVAALKARQAGAREGTAPVRLRQGQGSI